MFRILDRLVVKNNLIFQTSVPLSSKYYWISSSLGVKCGTNLHPREIRVLKTKAGGSSWYTHARSLSPLCRNFSTMNGWRFSTKDFSYAIHADHNMKLLIRQMSANNNKKKKVVDDDDDEDDDNNEEEEKRKEKILNFLIFLSLLGTTALIFSLQPKNNTNEQHNSDDTFVTSWSTFYKTMLVTGEVEKLVVNEKQDHVYVYLRPGANINNRYVLMPGPHYVFSISSVESLERKLAQAQHDLGVDPAQFITVKYNRRTGVAELFDILTISVLALILLILVRRRFSKTASKMKGQLQGMMSPSKSKATIIEPGSLDGVRFRDVAGMQEAKEEVMEFIDYLKDPTRFTALGAKIPKGALLVGPPGTGKTLLAKAVATEADVPFFSVAGTDFVEIFGGVGPARVRDLFSQARDRSPCIVYVDEIDSIGRARSSGSMGVNMERENTLNQLLVEMDGMNTLEGVVMLASTNREGILDKALLRPGRFDRRIEIPLPTLLERQEIFEVYLSKLKLMKPASTYSKRLAELTPSKSGADISNICNEAALHAARLNERNVGIKNFDYAVERVIAGIEKNSHSMSPEERKMIAYHEAGHILVGWMLEHTEALLKVSIAPHTNSVFGYTLHLPSDQFLWTLEKAMDTMSMSFGGRAAESHIFKKITTGSRDDLKKITRMARKMVIEYGMIPRVGNISFSVPEEGEIQRRFYSNSLQQVMDEEVNILIRKSWEKSSSIISENEGKLHILAKELLEKEVLSYENIEAVLGPCPWGDKRKLTKD